MKITLTKNLGMLLLAIFLILAGARLVVPTLLAFLPSVVDGIVAVVAGILLLLGR